VKRFRQPLAGRQREQAFMHDRANIVDHDHADPAEQPDHG
jgi:hypothetical protein